ncbi:hypothetical protein [Desulfolucanica intricata]|uniref:hypothetical protein n=1 Tax=Desulfolucanica intricata TaxID=1285191 RepID=UPI000834057C|nr:hypothetical protein [Desulfolucanica intricata]
MQTEMLELLKRLPPINTLNPIISENKIKGISEMTGFGINYHHLIDVAVSLTLTDILFVGTELDEDRYYKCRDLAGKAGNFLIRECTEDWQRILSITFLAKGMVKSLLEINNIELSCIETVESEESDSLSINIFLPSIDINTVGVMSKFCVNNNITALELLDVGLAWLNVDKLTAYDSITRQTLYLDFQRLKDAANIGKMLNRFFRSLESNPENIIIANLILLKVCITNLIGKCAKEVC